MKKLFLTSDTNHYHKINSEKIPNEIDNTNGIVNQIKQLIDNKNAILYIAASPNDNEKIDIYANLLFDALRLSGIAFSEYLVLDSRTKNNASEYVKKANIVFLSGGDTYIENEFFKQIHLKELLQDFDGIVIGQSAGSINMAESVYNSPEVGDLSLPIYYEGLGLTNINIEPHFILDTIGFDDMKMYQRKHQLEESKKRPIYALCDGAHILETDESITVYGKAFLIKDGIITQISGNKQTFNIDKEKNFLL